MTQQNSRRRRGPLVLAAAALMIVIVLSLDLFRHQQAPPASSDLTLMLRSDAPEERATAAAEIGRRRELQLSAALFPRMSDADWRVRAAAFDSMRQLAGHLPDAPDATPLRDTPVTQREELILAWLAAWRNASEQDLPPLPRLCELYAPPEHWLSGPVLAEACLGCHAPVSDFMHSDFIACNECHAHAHETWLVSAHASSTMHLNLARVDERTKQVVAYDFGERIGIDCTGCHRPIAPAASAPPPAGTENLRPPHHFAPAAQSCANCHQPAQHEWEAWRSIPRPRMASWPPGELEWSDRSEAQSCVDCHMPEHSLEPGALDHRFAVRRDRELLMSGLHARIDPASADQPPRLVLTNLAGHAYPTGTVRRALRIEILYDDDDSTRTVLSRLAPPDNPALPADQPALAPAEQRAIELPMRDGASRITCEIIYERNQLIDSAMEVRLHRLSAPLSRPMRLSQ